MMILCKPCAPCGCAGATQHQELVLPKVVLLLLPVDNVTALHGVLMEIPGRLKIENFVLYIPRNKPSLVDGMVGIVR